MRTLRYTAGAVAIAIVVAAAGCGSTTKPAASGGGGPSNATFTYASENSIVTDFDPATSYSNEVIAMNNVYEQLTRYDSKTNTVKPLLATHWVSSGGGKTWTFTLRSGATFHTGRPVTAEAARAAIVRTQKLNGGAAYIWSAVKSIDTPDPQTLVFHLSYPAPLDLISSSAYAAYIYDTKAAGSQDLTAWFGQARDAGSGPYTVSQWNKGQENELRLERYPKYWGGWSGAHYAHALFKFVPEATTRAQLLQSGEVTFSERLSPQLFEQAKSESAVQTTQRGSFQNLLAMFNTASGPLKDLRVRQAVAEAIDYAGIISALKGSAVAANGFVPNGLIGFDSSITNVTDTNRAASLLAAAGYGPGKQALSLSLTLSNGDADEALVASIIKSDLAQLNVTVNVQPLEWQTQWSRAKSTDPAKRQDIFLFYWYPDYADAYSWFINLFHSADPPYFNLSYYDDAHVDAQIDSLESMTATDRTAASAAYDSIQHTLIDQAVAAPLYVQNYQRVFARTMSGYVDNPAYSNVVFIYDVRPTG